MQPLDDQPLFDQRFDGAPERRVASVELDLN